MSRSEAKPKDDELRVYPTDTKHPENISSLPLDNVLQRRYTATMMMNESHKGDNMSYTVESGLIVGPAPGQCAGYIVNFAGHGAYDPTGKVKVGDLELTEEQVKAHNKILADAELKAIVERGKGTFYFSYDLTVDPPYSPSNPRWHGRSTRRYSNYRVSNFDGSFRVSCFANRSFTPGFNCSERWHVYFTGPDGKRWYGVHQGESHQLLRARRLKKQD